MAKKSTRGKVVKELDRVFSLHVRQRNMDENQNVSCYTCGRSNHYKKMQCGHFMTRARYSTRWDEVNCQTQCYGCNVMQQGKQYEFGLNLDKEFGVGVSENLYRKSMQTVKFMTYELEEKIEHYKSLIETN